MDNITTYFSSPVRIAIRVVPLYDADGSNTVVTPVSHVRNGNVNAPSLYSYSIAGAGDATFVVDPLGQNSMYIEDISIRSLNAVDVDVSIEFEIAGQWRSGGLAYSYTTDPNLAMKGTPTQSNPVCSTDFNTIKIGEAVAGTPMRIRCTVSGSTTIYCQVLEG